MSEIFTSGPHHCGDFDHRYLFNNSTDKNASLEFYCTIRDVYGILTTTVCCLGIIGNAMSLAILPKTGGAKSALVLLTGLGVYDTLFLASGMFLKYLPSISIAGSGVVHMSNALSPLMFPLFLLSHFGSAYTTVAISVERCIAVTTPFSVFRWLTTRRVKIVTVGILVWSLVYNIPRLILLKPSTYWDASLNRTWLRLEPTNPSRNYQFLVIYFGYFNTGFKVVLPILVVSLSNIILLCCLRRRHKAFAQHMRLDDSSTNLNNLAVNSYTTTVISNGNSTAYNTSVTASVAANNLNNQNYCRGNNNSRAGHGSSRCHQDNKVTSVVLAITCTFLISQLFSGFQVIKTLTNKSNECDHNCHLYNQVCDLVNVTVAATNFLLYYAFGQRFRRILRGYVCCYYICCCGKRCPRRSRSISNRRFVNSALTCSLRHQRSTSRFPDASSFEITERLTRLQ